MGGFHVACIILNPKRPAIRVSLKRVLVDTGSEFTWVPAEKLQQAGITVRKKDVPFRMASGQIITRDVGYAILQANGFETVDEVVFAQPGDLPLLGSRTLEGFGATVDARRKRLVAAGPQPVARVLRQSARSTQEVGAASWPRSQAIVGAASWPRSQAIVGAASWPRSGLLPEHTGEAISRTARRSRFPPAVRPLPPATLAQPLNSRANAAPVRARSRRTAERPLPSTPRPPLLPLNSRPSELPNSLFP
jgi:predicted aspartyl protease